MFFKNCSNLKNLNDQTKHFEQPLISYFLQEKLKDVKHNVNTNMSRFEGEKFLVINHT